MQEPDEQVREHAVQIRRQAGVRTLHGITDET
jgi:hypothetical protein